MSERFHFIDDADLVKYIENLCKLVPLSMSQIVELVGDYMTMTLVEGGYLFFKTEKGVLLVPENLMRQPVKGSEKLHKEIIIQASEYLCKEDAIRYIRWLLDVSIGATPKYTTGSFDKVSRKEFYEIAYSKDCEVTDLDWGKLIIWK